MAYNGNSMIYRNIHTISIKSYANGGGIMSYNIKEFIDIKRVENFLESFYALTGIGGIIVDKDNNILLEIGTRKACKNFLRRKKEIENQCFELFNNIINSIGENEYTYYTCDKKFSVLIIPIKINNIHIVTIVSGQFLLSPPDIPYYSSLAKEYNFNILEFIDSVKEIPVISTERIDDIAKFFCSFKSFYCDYIYKQISQNESNRLIRKQEEFLREITDNTLDMISKTDTNGNFIYVSPSHTKILGYDVEYLKTCNIFDFFHPDEIAIAKDEFLLLLQLDKEQAKEYRFRHKDGHYIYLETIAKLIYGQNGSANGIIFCSRDISERKKAEEMDELMKQIMEYDKLKTEFFANISHELRTPLNVILGSIQVTDLKIRSIIEEKNEEKLRKYIYMMRQNCYRLMRLINNLIDVTKIDAGHFELNLKNMDIVSVIENIVLSIASYAESKGIDIIFDTDIEEKCAAIDPDIIERIILNLLSNAIKYTPSGGFIFVNINDNNDNILITVKDTGTGIPKENLSLIFKRYVQLDNHGRANVGGSGIGLSLVKSLVELSGGTISVQSEIGEGTEFIICLPCSVVKHKDCVQDSFNISNTNIEKIQVEFSDIYNCI